MTGNSGFNVIMNNGKNHYFELDSGKNYWTEEDDFYLYLLTSERFEGDIVIGRFSLRHIAGYSFEQEEQDYYDN